MIKFNKIISTIILLCANNLSLNAQALHFAPKPYIIASENSRYYFKMAYVSAKDRNPKNGCGTAFEYDDISGKENILWESNGWFSYNTYISSDGQYLVRIENPATINNDTIVYFYKAGNLIHSYTIDSLVKVKRKKLYYPFEVCWLKKTVGYENVYFFKLITLENNELLFTIESGDIISKKRLWTEYIKDFYSKLKTFLLSIIY